MTQSKSKTGYENLNAQKVVCYMYIQQNFLLFFRRAYSNQRPLTTLIVAATQGQQLLYQKYMVQRYCFLNCFIYLYSKGCYSSHSLLQQLLNKFPFTLVSAIVCPQTSIPSTTYIPSPTHTPSNPTTHYSHHSPSILFPWGIKPLQDYIYILTGARQGGALIHMYWGAINMPKICFLIDSLVSGSYQTSVRFNIVGVSMMFLSIHLLQSFP